MFCILSSCKNCFVVLSIKNNTGIPIQDQMLLLPNPVFQSHCLDYIYNNLPCYSSYYLCISRMMLVRTTHHAEFILSGKSCGNFYQTTYIVEYIGFCIIQPSSKKLHDTVVICGASRLWRFWMNS